MGKINNAVCAISGNEKNKDIAIVLASLFLWAEVFLNLFRVVGSTYQTPRDAFYYKACFFFFMLVLVIYRGKIFNWFSVVVVLSFISGLVWYLIKNKGGFGETYRDLVIYKTLSVALFFVTIICMVYGKIWRNCVLILRNKWTSLFVIISFTLIIYPSWTGWLISFAPIVCFYFAFRSLEDWKKQILIMLLAGYLASTWFFYKSFKEAPYAYLESRYIGNFAYPSAGCYIAVIGIICIFCFAGYLKSLSKWKWLVVIVLSIPQMIILAKSFSITSILAFGVAAFILLFSCHKSKPRKVIIAIFAALCGLGLFSLFAIDYSLIKGGVEQARAFTESFGDRGALRHIADKMVNVLFTDYHQVFQPHTIGNFFDRILSDRLSIWMKGIERISFFDMVGYGECAVYLPDGTYMGHPHNSYIAWMLLSGGIRGMLLSISVVVLLCMAFKDAKKDIFGAKFCLLWISFSAVVFLSEYKGWTHILYWGMLILAFPLLFSFREDKHLD